MPDNNNIELRSEEVQEILGKPPNWIIRSAITILFFVILTLIVGSYFFKYPDFINARITIISKNPPIPIVAKTSGKLEYLLVTDRQYVIRGQIIGIIENPADFHDVLKLKNYLDSIKYMFNNPAEIIAIALPEQLKLGPNQSYYTTFISQWNEYESFIQLDSYGQQMKSLLNQTSDNKLYLTLMREQIGILKEDLELSDKQLVRDSILYSKEVLSQMQFEQSQTAYYRQKYNYKNAISNLSNTQIQINQLEQQLLGLKIQKSEQRKKLLAGLKERFENLNAQIESWEQTYVLKSSIDGIITFTDLWYENQQIQMGSTVFTIVPKIELPPIGKLVMPIIGSGKVEKGQKVIIKLDNFPYLEYGLLEGVISTISLVPVITSNGGYYIAEVKLNNGLKTNYSKQLSFNQEMQGTAEIITNDRRLIERFIQPLIAIIKRNVE